MSNLDVGFLPPPQPTTSAVPAAQAAAIPGYRDLSPADLDMMKLIKQHAEATRALQREVERYIGNRLLQFTGPDARDCDPARWASIACTHFQQGYMTLTRAVAAPSFF